jgi:hypothetical protein
MESSQGENKQVVTFTVSVQTTECVNCKANELGCRVLRHLGPCGGFRFVVAARHLHKDTHRDCCNHHHQERPEGLCWGPLTPTAVGRRRQERIGLSRGSHAPEAMNLKAQVSAMQPKVVVTISRWE